MDVIDVSSSDTEDYLLASEEEYSNDGSEPHHQGTGNAIRENELPPSAESIDGIHQYHNDRSGKGVEDVTEDIEKNRDDPPLGQTLSENDEKTVVEHRSRRILPSSFLPMGGPQIRTQTQRGRETLKNNATVGAKGSGIFVNGEIQAKPFLGSMHKRFLPPLQPATSKTVLESPILDDEDIQILGIHKKSDSFGGTEVKLGANGHGFPNQMHPEQGRHLPPWMSRGSSAEHLAVSSSPSSSSTYLKTLGNHLGLGEKTIDQDERLIFQAALQDLNQPKHEGNISADLLAVSLLRHQRIALAWMHKKENSSFCSGGILADDQGLGKTVSIIALIQFERAQQDKFTSGVSDCIKSDALNLDEADNDTPKSNALKLDESDHSYGATSKIQNILENGNQNHELVSDFEEHSVKSDPSMPEIEKSSDDMKESSSNKECSKRTVHKGRPAGGTLVVCPASILRQWAHEIEEKVPENKKLSFLIYHGSCRSRDPSFLAKHDVVLTTYSIVSNEVPKQRDDDDLEQRNLENYALSPNFSVPKKKKRSQDEEKGGKGKRKKDSGVDQDSGALARVRWFRVVLDEAQTIKNFRTQVSKACCGLRAKKRWCLSGTPLQNSVDDLYSYFRFLRYDPYAVYGTFCSSIKNPISNNPTSGFKKLQAILRTIMLRRTKGTLIDGEPIIKLPPRVINLKKIYFTPEEREFYSNLEADSRQQFKAYAAAGTLNQNYASILLLLLRLRQACDHPLLVKEHHSSHAAKSSLMTARQLPREMLINLLNRLEASLAICGVCSDPPEEAVVTMCGHVFCYQCISGFLNGEVNSCPAAGCKDVLAPDSVFARSTLRSCLSGESLEFSSSSGVDGSQEKTFHSSSKINAAMEILRSICKSSSESKPPVKAIVFSQWTSMLDFLEVSLNHSLIQYRRLDGSMSLASRERAVRDFNTDPEVTVMIMSLKAGNLGLNMVAACHVILLDPWWNPTTEDQAIDRAHRIGQLRTVTVSRLTVCDTVEDRILALQEKKREMVSSAFGEDQTTGRGTRLTVEDLQYLFRV